MLKYWVKVFSRAHISQTHRWSLFTFGKMIEDTFLKIYLNQPCSWRLLRGQGYLHGSKFFIFLVLWAKSSSGELTCRPTGLVFNWMLHAKTAYSMSCL